MNSFFWVLYSYCVLERLGELVVSKRNQATMMSQGFSEKESSVGLNVMVAMHITWFVAMMGEALFSPTQLSSVVVLFLAVGFVAAQGLRFWTLLTLGAFWNISVVTTDRRREVSFVSNGPYRFMRHPNYLVVIVEIATLPIIGGAVWTAISFSLLNAIVLYRRIMLEESYLLRIPGYRESVGLKMRFVPTGLFDGWSRTRRIKPAANPATLHQQDSSPEERGAVRHL